MVRNADYNVDVNNLIQGGDTMVKRVEAFKADDGSIHEAENDAKLRDLADAICSGVDSFEGKAHLQSMLRFAMSVSRDAIIMQIEKDWC